MTKIISLTDNRLAAFVLRKFFFQTLFLLFTVGCFQLSIQAQEDDPTDAAPPPLKLLSKTETTALQGEKDIKRRNRLAIDLMDARLKKAEEMAARESFGEVFDELGGFHALMDSALHFLHENNTGRGRILDTYKRLEIALRGFLPRIELIRRDLPGEYEFYIKKLLRDVRDARARAVEPMFSDSVVPLADKDN